MTETRAVTVGVVVCSTSRAAGSNHDETGPVIARWATAHGWEVRGPQVVSDGPDVGEALRDLVAAETTLIITTGGTGLHPTDRTPEETLAIVTTPVPGIAEEIRANGLRHTPTAALSRGVAGIVGRTLIVNLPGSPGGVDDGLAVLDRMIVHALHQICG